MTEAELLEYSRPVVDVYTAMEHDLMVAVAAQIAKDGFVSATSKWRMQKLAEAGELNRTAVNIIASYTGIQSDVLTEAITSAAYDVIDNIEPALQAAAIYKKKKTHLHEERRSWQFILSVIWHLIYWPGLVIT